MYDVGVLTASNDRRNSVPSSVRTMNLAVFILCLWCLPVKAAQDEVYVIDAGQSTISGSLSYALIGTYQAYFKQFSGRLAYNPQHHLIRQVQLNINASSLASAFPALDKIVKSKRLLDAQQHPYLTFDSLNVGRQGNLFKVTGTIGLRGVTRRESFPFAMEGPLLAQDSRLYLKGEGHWIVNRRDFDFLWHPVLDKGGVVVGDHIKVDWQIVAYQQK